LRRLRRCAGREGEGDMTDPNNIYEQAERAARRESGLLCLFCCAFFLALVALGKFLCWLFPALNN